MANFKMSFRKVRSPLLLLFLSSLVFLLLDNVIYRSEFYSKYFLSPHNIGYVYYPMHEAMKSARDDKKDKVLFLGNSQIMEDFNLSQFRKLSSKSDFNLEVLSIFGTQEQVWYYAAKYVDPGHNKYKAIIIPLQDYKAEPFMRDRNDYKSATYIASFLKLKDWREFLEETPSDLRLKVGELALFQSHIYAANIQDYLTHFPQRFRARLAIKKGNTKPFKLSNVAWSDVTFDPQGHVLSCPNNDYRWCVGNSKALQLLPLDVATQKTKEYAAYEKKWLTKIIDLYRGSSTQLIFIQMPRTPIIPTVRTPLDDAPDIRDLVPRASNVHFWDEHTFEDLETPQYMYDVDHLNASGNKLFTEKMSKILPAYIANIKQ